MKSTSYIVHKLATEMDRKAEKLLRRQLSITYSQFYFMLVVSQHGSLTQHSLAMHLGYSDPAVSKLVAEALKAKFVVVEVDTLHKRRRLVSLTDLGQRIVKDSLTILDDCFNDVLIAAGVDQDSYLYSSQAIVRTIEAMNKEER